MSTAASLVTKLAATVAVTNIVADRIYSVSAPDGVTSPHVVFQHIASSPGASHVGACGATEELFQFACFAATPKAARALRDAIITALDGVALDNGANPTLEDARDGDVDDGAKLYRADADFLI